MQKTKTRYAKYAKKLCKNMPKICQKSWSAKICNLCWVYSLHVFAKHSPGNLLRADSESDSQSSESECQAPADLRPVHSKELVPSPRIPIPRSNFGAGHKKLRCHQAAASRGGPGARPFRVAAGPDRRAAPTTEGQMFLFEITDGHWWRNLQYQGAEEQNLNEWHWL